MVHLGSESSAKLLMEKFPKIELNGQKPIVTPANENTLQQFENVVKKQRKNSGSKHENNSSAPSNPIGKIWEIKVGCVFTMVIWSDFRLEWYRADYHQEDTPHFIC